MSGSQIKKKLNPQFFRATMLVGIFWIFYSQNTEASLENWLEKIASTEDRALKVDYYLDLGKELIQDPDLTIQYANEGISIAREIHYTVGESNLLNLIGVANWQKGDLEEAIRCYQLSLQLLTPGEKDKERASILGNMGLAYMNMGVFDSALEYLTKCQELRKQLGDTKALSGVCMNLGIVYYYKGEFEKAITTLLEAAEYSNELGDLKSLSSFYNNIGSIYLEIEDLPKAEQYFLESLKIDEASENNEERAFSLGNLANIDLKRGEFEEAIEKFSVVLEIEAAVQNKSNIAAAYNGLGDAYRGITQIDRAIGYYEEALKMNNASGDQNAKTITLISLSEVSILIGDSAEIESVSNEAWEKANDYATRALTLAEAIDSPSQQEKSHFQLYQGFRRLGNFELALFHHEQFKEISEQLMDSEKYQQISELESKYQLVSKTREIEGLQANNQIQELQIEEQSQRVLAQRRMILLSMVIFAMVLIIALIYTKLYRTRQQNVKNELLIQNLKTEQKLLRSQMNPHFIFNSLNSIQAFISSNEPYLAEKYLAKFAKLMRGILENSFLEFVPFSKELEVIRSYLELEQLRFEGRFQFRIEIDDDFEETFISIPPMIIQPFLENAILHGFKNVTSGLLQLSFREEGKTVYCIIDDNGIGRERAGSLNERVDKKSLATFITNRRLETALDASGNSGSVTIIDKVDEQTGEPCGTRVELNIPYIEMTSEVI